jgi:hypothetical protein
VARGTWLDPRKDTAVAAPPLLPSLPSIDTADQGGSNGRPVWQRHLPSFSPEANRCGSRRGVVRPCAHQHAGTSICPVGLVCPWRVSRVSVRTPVRVRMRLRWPPDRVPLLEPWSLPVTRTDLSDRRGLPVGLPRRPVRPVHFRPELCPDVVLVPMRRVAQRAAEAGHAGDSTLAIEGAGLTGTVPGYTLAGP